MIIPHACTMTRAHPYIMIIVQACIMIIVHACIVNIEHACIMVITCACSMITVHACRGVWSADRRVPLGTAERFGALPGRRQSWIQRRRINNTVSKAIGVSSRINHNGLPRSRVLYSGVKHDSGISMVLLGHHTRIPYG